MVDDGELKVITVMDPVLIQASQEFDAYVLVLTCNLGRD